MLDEKPINLAPRDGTIIMLWCDDGIWRKASWLEADIWQTLDGELRIRGTTEIDHTIITAPIWALPATADDDIGQVAVMATVGGSVPRAAE